MPMSTEITPEQIRQEVARVIAWGDVAASGQLSRFLAFAVNETLAGRGESLKERTIALKALQRGRDFNPQLDPIVRVLAGKLRRALERYYLGDGALNQVRIEIPKGGYRPTFVLRCAPDSSPSVKHESRCDVASHPIGRPATRPVLAIVPFVVFTEGVQERQLADVMAHDLRVHLSRSTWLEIADYLVARVCREQPHVPIAVVSHRNADYCLSGTARVQGNSLRMVVQLTDARSGTLVWTHRLEFPADGDNVALYDTAVVETAGRISDIFGVLATAISRRTRGKSILQLTACEATLSNMNYQMHLSDRLFADAFRTAEHAVKAEPDFAWGWAALALLHLDNYSRVAGGDERCAADEALTCLRTALKLDPTCAFTHLTVAIYHLMQGHTDEALTSAEHCVEQADYSPFQVGAAGAVMSAAGEHDRGLMLIHRALAANPRLPGWIHWGTVMHDIGRADYAQARTTTQKFTLSECFWDHLFNATALARVGDVESARASVRQACVLRPELAARSREIVSKIVLVPSVQRDLLDSLRLSGLDTL